MCLCCCRIEKYYDECREGCFRQILYCAENGGEAEKVICCVPYQCATSFCGSLCDCEGCCREFDGDGTIENSEEFGKRVALICKNILRKFWACIKVFSKIYNLFLGILILGIIFLLYPILSPIAKQYYYQNG
jgi:hypothetical protein